MCLAKGFSHFVAIISNLLGGMGVLTSQPPHEVKRCANTDDCGELMCYCEDGCSPKVGGLPMVFVEYRTNDLTFNILLRKERNGLNSQTTTSKRV